ncbi:hypothetical protein MYX78_10325, partial [Acidobacteria bacterium AH-259-G07]|nr:hypothetical protein [Acidobacteria bacterium AH-259-G07]
MRETDWITLDYLEFFCQQNHLIIGCKRGDDEVWISPLGPHPSTLTSDEVHDILRKSGRFEIRSALDEDSDLTTSHFL